MVWPARVQDIFDAMKVPVRLGEFRRPIDLNRSEDHQILMSYLVAGLELDRKEISKLLTLPSDLRELLALCIPAPVPMERFENWPYCRIEGGAIADHLALVTGRHAFGMGLADHSQLLLADAAPTTFTFPSGWSFDYLLLRREQTANMPVFESGYTSISSDGRWLVALREASIATRLAMMDARRDDPVLAGHRRFMERFEEFLPAVILAHEIGHLRSMGLWDGGPLDDSPEARSELAAEHEAWRFLQEEGVSLGYYELRHLLGISEKVDTVAAHVRDAGFRP